MAVHPELVEVTKKADGWVKKYELTYRFADGRLFTYHCATRRDEDEFRAELERNAEQSRSITSQIEQGEPTSHAEDKTQAVPDAVCIVARTPRDTVVLQREFRYPLNSWCVAFPAGLVDPGEDILTCASRELEEETGYKVIPEAHFHALPQAGYSSTGLTDETVQIVYVQAERTGTPNREANELIEVFELPINEIRKFLDTNRLPIGTRAQLILETIALARTAIG